MFEQEIARKLLDFRVDGIPKYYPRKAPVIIVDRMVSTVIGGRRTGKSFRVIQSADELLRKKFIKSADQICYLDFDNSILSKMNSKDLPQIQTTFLKLSPQFDTSAPLVFILDEIHKIPGWEDYVVDLSRNPHWKVFVTGSSSKLIRQEIATELRGKAVSSEIYPLSFSEYLTFKELTATINSTKGMAEVKRFFDEYLAWGGYPALVHLDNFTREAVLREYFDTMILKDVIERYDVSKPKQCVYLYEYLLSNIGKPFTLQSAFGHLKTAGFDTSRDTVRDYLGWASDSWLTFAVSIYSDSLKEQARNYKKLYAIDWALAHTNSFVWDGGLSRSLENLVFIHLKQKWRKVFYYLTKSKRQEVDFIVKDTAGRPAMAVQVCLDITGDETRNRELEPLIAASRYFGIKNSFIVTLNNEADFNSEGVKVKAIPAWKWLLGP
jgi:hypothetical protein